MTTVPAQPTGDFYAPLNRYKAPGDDKPIFVGKLTKPGSDAEFPFSLWAFTYADKKTGEIKTGYSGNISGVPTNIPAKEQIEALLADSSSVNVTIANLTLRPGQIVLFPNDFKDQAPDKRRPDLWGWINPTDGTAPFKPAVWVHQYQESGRAYLSGQTQYPQPGKSAGEQQPTLDQMLESGQVSRGMPKAKGSRQARA